MITKLTSRIDKQKRQTVLLHNGFLYAMDKKYQILNDEKMTQHKMQLNLMDIIMNFLVITIL